MITVKGIQMYPERVLDNGIHLSRDLDNRLRAHTDSYFLGYTDAWGSDRFEVHYWDDALGGFRFRRTFRTRSGAERALARLVTPCSSPEKHFPAQRKTKRREPSPGAKESGAEPHS